MRVDNRGFKVIGIKRDSRWANHGEMDDCAGWGWVQK